MKPSGTFSNQCLSRWSRTSASLCQQCGVRAAAVAAPDTGWRRAECGRTGGRTSAVCCSSTRRPTPHRRPARSESRFSIEGPVDTQTTTNNAATARRTRAHTHTRAPAHARQRFPPPRWRRLSRPRPTGSFTRTHTDARTRTFVI